MKLDKDKFERDFNEKWGWWRKYTATNPNTSTFISLGVGAVVGYPVLHYVILPLLF